MGIDKYNAHCRSIVSRYCSEWEVIIGRLGRWIDFKNDYKTMEPWYMESVWWVFKTLFEKGLVYRSFKVMPYSTACNTPLSNFEAGLNYKDDTADPAVVVTFPREDDPTTSFVAWTTTPWTLPSNLALCVHPELVYATIQDKKTGKKLVMAESRIVQLYPKFGKKDYVAGSEFEVLSKCPGKELVGLRYTPLFPYFQEEYKATAFRVVSDTYVTDDAGTGIVHQAPAFGEDDWRVCTLNGVISKDSGVVPCPIDANGRFTAEVKEFVGQYVKDADEAICAKLKAEGRLAQKGTLIHSYPFCWRSETPLIYRAVPSWFVRVESIKDRLLANNDQTYWVPDSVKVGRFANWLRDARDWAVSRNRYWGTPLPIWTSEDGEEIVVIGSVQELYEKSGVKVTDLHRESVDGITIPSSKGKGVLKRVEEVFDW
jgi:isoleucyl-tRNA synthetase